MRKVPARFLVMAMLFASIMTGALPASGQQQPPEKKPEGTGASEGATPAQATPATPRSAPAATSDPRQILVSAKTVCVVGVLGEVVHTGRLMMDPNPERAKNKLEEALKKWGRFTLVADPKDADLVLVIIEGNTSGTFVRGMLLERLLVFKGGTLPDRTAVPLWEGQAKETVGRPAGKLSEQLRKQIEEYAKAGVTAPAPPQTAQSISAPAGTPAESEKPNATAVSATEQKTEAVFRPEQNAPPEQKPQPERTNIAEPAESKPTESNLAETKPAGTAGAPPAATPVVNVTNSAEVLLSTKTAAVVASGPEPEGGTKGFFGGMLTGVPPSARANALRAKKVVEKEIGKWKRYTLVEEPTHADLVVHITEWDHMGILGGHCVGARLAVLKGGATWQQDPQLVWVKKDLWCSGWSPTNSLAAALRKDVEKLAKLPEKK